MLLANKLMMMMGPRVVQCGLAEVYFRSAPSGVFIHPAIWPQQTWAKIGWGWLCFFSGGSWVHIEHNVA